MAVPSGAHFPAAVPVGSAPKPPITISSRTWRLTLAFGLFLARTRRIWTSTSPLPKVTSDFMVDVLRTTGGRATASVSCAFALRGKCAQSGQRPGKSRHRAPSSYEAPSVEFPYATAIADAATGLAIRRSTISKYNPVERGWGVLEKLLGAVNCWKSRRPCWAGAARMTYNGKHPTIHRTTGTYLSGVRLTAPERRVFETFLQRDANLSHKMVDPH